MAVDKSTFFGVALVLSGLFISSATFAQVPVGVETEQFGQDSFALGSLSATQGALPRDLWAGASAEDVAYLLKALPTKLDHPAQTEAYKRLLLSPGSAPIGSSNALTGAKLLTIAKVGFYDEAAGLAESSGRLANEPELSQAAAYAAMMNGDMTEACQRGASLLRGRDMPFWLKLRLLCYAASGEPAAADLTFGLLQESSDLSSTDIALFNAVATGTKPRNPVAPIDGFHYAAIRQMELPLTEKLLENADGAVIKAIALEPAAPPEVRAWAAERMYAHGALSRQKLADIFASFEFATDRLASASGVQKDFPDNLLVDALVFQAAALPGDGSGLDRQEMIGKTLRNAGGGERFQALAALYQPMIQQFGVIENFAPYASEFVLVGIATENRTLIERWIGALLLDKAATDTTETALNLLELTAQWDRGLADYIISSNGLPTVATSDLSATFPAVADSGASLSKLVEIGIDAAEARSKGLSGLVALAGMGIKANGELANIRDAVTSRSFEKSGLDLILRDVAFDAEIARVHKIVSQRQVQSPPATTTSSQPASDITVPRLKPTRQG